ncbi:hypothetical protein GGX14DRAFT_554371 [Mycena pura]|uniref:Uncharacterized protein n=1 Tax=Mycena pura TaxID=153505 RepID=A0AAD7E4E0_9AGAR|nr:hypothetical protein GGX14DRAFT_554371 [Mycena pura]
MDVTLPRVLHFVPYTSPVSPLGRKRQRLDPVAPGTPQSWSTTRAMPALPHSPYRFNSDGVVVDAEPAIDKLGVVPDSKLSLDTTAAMLALDADAHRITKVIREKEQDDKQTKGSYSRHIKHYQTHWATIVYAAGDPATGRTPLPAMPITVGKAIIFLQYESTRPQKKRKHKASDDADDEPETS